jgi:hypothetical protein
LVWLQLSRRIEKPVLEGKNADLRAVENDDIDFTVGFINDMDA